MDIGHPDFFRQLRLVLEATFGFSLRGIGGAVCCTAVAGLDPTTRYFGRSPFALLFDVVYGPLDSLILPEYIVKDLDLHHESSLTKPRPLFLRAVQISSFLLTRVLLRGYATAFRRPLFTLFPNPSLIIEVVYALLVVGISEQLMPRSEVASHRNSAAKFLARFVSAPFEAWIYRLKVEKSKTFVEPRLHPSDTRVLYKYNPIDDPRVIRLIKLEPDANRVSCTLEIVAIDDAPEYWAVSYLWGSNKISEFLVVGRSESRSIPINRNCAAVLRLLAPTKTRYLWIDAVCINQNDNVEKAGQIPLMKEIYSQAAQVIGYIGEESDLPVGDFLLRLVQYATHETKSFNFDLIGDAKDWEALWPYFITNYWVRAWILQELVLAQSMIFINRGGTFSWRHFYYVVKSLSDRLVLGPNDYLPEGHSLQTLDEILTRICVQKDRIGKRDRYHWPTVAQLLEYWEFTEATDPRDRVYAMLGLSSDSDEPALQAKYDDSMTVRQLSTNITLHYFSQGSLYLFLRAGLGYRDGNTVSGQPSWVPDLSSVTLSRRGNWAVENERNRTCFLEIEASEDQNELCLSGVLVDELVVCSTKNVAIIMNQVGQILKDPNDLKIISKEFAAIYDESKRLVEMRDRCPYYPEMTAHEAHWRIMMLDIFDGETPAPAAAEQALQEVLESIRFVMTNDSTPAIENFWKSQKLNPGFSAMNHWVSYVFAVTAAGYMAWVPNGAQKGDVLCFFNGSKLPFLLRPHEDKETCALVGEAYLQGFMHGETRSVEKRSFRLR